MNNHFYCIIMWVWLLFCLTPSQAQPLANLSSEMDVDNLRISGSPMGISAVKESVKSPDNPDSTLRVSLTDIYDKGRFFTFMRGENYRNIWQTPVDFRVFNLAIEQGGLSVIKKGGGQQTRSLRLEDQQGHQYVLRSVNKYVEKALPVNFRHTIAVDLLQDGISASFPYGATTIPTMAEAIGVMHTNPEYVWLPDDTLLGPYREEFANQVYLFEERPAGRNRDLDSYGRPEELISTPDVIKKIRSQSDCRVDQNSVVRARIFDILINDWDRHDDQWRWAGFKENGMMIYRPIPRDRDQVYFVNEGLGMWMATRFYPLRKFHGFENHIYDIKGLTYNARYFDRYFMNEPDHDQWLMISNDIQRKVTDSVIHQAISALPENVYDSCGMELEGKLKSRRDQLDKAIAEYYQFLSKDVDVTGTNQEDLFLVHRLENGNADVKVYALSEKKRKTKALLYHREFKYAETKEIRLYGLKGDDKVAISGYGKRGIKVRIIGGKGEDTIMDQSRVRGPGKMTIVYDRKDKPNVIIPSRETRTHLAKDKSINVYNRSQFRYNTTIPLMVAGYNVDDGIYLGGGVKVNRYHFRDSTEHKIKGYVALQTGAFSLRYDGLFSTFVRPFDLLMEAQVSVPENVNNYFGLGNNTVQVTDDKSYYRVRYHYIWLNPMLQHTSGDHFNYSFGPFYQYFKVVDTNNRFIGHAYPQWLDSAAYGANHYAGVSTRLKYDNHVGRLLPTKGVIWETRLQAFHGMGTESEDLVKLMSDLRLYFSSRKLHRLTVKLRMGGALNFGNYAFYHANFLGGKTNLRGYRSNRFAGEQSVYFNEELWCELFDIQSYVFNGRAGVMLFNDVGRVWVRDENSKSWHTGYGAGIWGTPYEASLITLTYNGSAEENIVEVSFRLMF